MKTAVGILGCGNMGGAILARVAKEFKVSICEADKRKTVALKRKYKVRNLDLARLAEQSDVLILAVKPQGFPALLEELKPFIHKNQLVISIAAGITSKFIERQLKGVPVIRAMPNMPAQIGEGVTALARGKHATAKHMKLARNILDHIGATVEVKEKDMDAITAVSGSGPAYLFYFAECLTAAARRLGLRENAARELVEETLLGSVHLLSRGEESAAELRAKVTSKGGTTAAALKVFKDKKFKQAVNEALKAARKRAKELSK